MTKHAIRALGECLRQELLDAPGIAVCTLLPGWSSVDGGWRQPARAGARGGLALGVLAALAVLLLLMLRTRR
jgi:hypothetical protein